MYVYIYIYSLLQVGQYIENYNIVYNIHVFICIMVSVDIKVNNYNIHKDCARKI